MIGHMNSIMYVITNFLNFKSTLKGSTWQDQKEAKTKYRHDITM